MGLHYYIIMMKWDLQEALGKQTEFIQLPDQVYLLGKFEKGAIFLRFSAFLLCAFVHPVRLFPLFVNPGQKDTCLPYPLQ